MAEPEDILETRPYRGHSIDIIDTRGDLADRYFIVKIPGKEDAEFWDYDCAEGYIDELLDGPGESYEEANQEHRLRGYQLV